LISAKLQIPQLTDLQKVKDSGAIADAEYQTHKAKLLA
jgi:hypothetical protein